MENVVKLKDDDILRIKIETPEGKPTGEYLEFNLEDIELPLIYQDLVEKDKKNREYLRNELMLIDKREDVKGKKLLSKNQEDEIRAFQKFYIKEKEIYNMFLGERGVEKLLNGKKLSWTSLQEIDEIIEKQIAPYLEKNMTSIQDKIKEKYTITNKNKEVLE